MAPQIPGFNIVWADDFDGPKGSPPNTSDNWNINQDGPNRGSGEIQQYTNHTNNVCLLGTGAVWLMPTKDGNGNWTSAKLEGKHKFSCEAGKKMILQASIRTGSHPTFQQKGVWPAFWALGDAFRRSGSDHLPWPQCGEWDILENTGGEGFTLASLHYGTGEGSAKERSVGGNLGNAEQKSFVVEQFNTFSLQVDRSASSFENETLTWSLNGQPWFTARGSE